MANSTTVSDPEFWAGESLDVLRNNLVMAGLVNRGFDSQLGSEGDTVNVQIPPTLSTRSKSRGGNFTTDNMNLTNVQVVVDTHEYVDFVIERVEQSMSALDLVNTFVTPAAVALAEKIETDLCNLADDIDDATGRYTDTLGENELLNARRKAWVKKFPNPTVAGNEWNLVVHPDQERDILGIGDLRNANTVGDMGSAIRNANIGERFGLRFFISQLVQNTGTGNNNMLFHRNAFALATKSLGSSFATLPGALTSTISEGGYSITSTMSYHGDRGGMRVTLEVLYGVKLVRQAYAIRVNSAAVTAASSSSSGS